MSNAYISLPMSGHTSEDIKARGQKVVSSIFSLVQYCEQIQENGKSREDAVHQLVLERLVDSSDTYDIIETIGAEFEPWSWGSNQFTSYGMAMGRDIEELIDGCEIVIFDKGWTDSAGCRIEFVTALERSKVLLKHEDGKFSAVQHSEAGNVIARLEQTAQHIVIWNRVWLERARCTTK